MTAQVKYPTLDEAQKAAFREACISDPTLNPRAVCPLCRKKLWTVEPLFRFIDCDWVHSSDECRCRHCRITYGVRVPAGTEGEQ